MPPGLARAPYARPMRRQVRLDVLFVLVLIASAVMLTLVLVQKSRACAEQDGALVVEGRSVRCRLVDGSTIPF